MKLYKISQEENCGYDTYDSAIVAAPDEETARNMNPSEHGELMIVESDWGTRFSVWCSSPDSVTVVYLGEADNSDFTGVLCSSFNAG